jgi:hypothetical protein
MKYTKLSIGILITILLLGVTCMNVFGFLFGSARTEKWKEEVQLSDGRTIAVERETVMERGGDELTHNRSGTKPKERCLRFVNPDGSGKMVKWCSTKSYRTWPEKPLILDFVSGQPIIFTSVGISTGCEVYLKYVYSNDKWNEEILPETFEKLKTNLLIRDGVDMPKFVDLETKRNANSSDRYRRSLKQVGPTRKVLMN